MSSYVEKLKAALDRMPVPTLTQIIRLGQRTIQR